MKQTYKVMSRQMGVDPAAKMFGLSIDSSYKHLNQPKYRASALNNMNAKEILNKSSKSQASTKKRS